MRESYANEPGAKRSAVFLDRDGVVNELVFDPRSGRSESPLRPEDVRLLPGVSEATRRLRQAGYVLVGVTNQPAAAKGVLTVAELVSVHARVVSLLADDGVVFDDWRLCLHHPDGTVPGLTQVCTCRKPAPGMLLAAAGELDLDLVGSWMVGDTDRDVEAGRAARCRTVLIEQSASAHKRSGSASPDRRAANLAQAAAIITGDEEAG